MEQKPGEESIGNKGSFQVSFIQRRAAVAVLWRCLGLNSYLVWMCFNESPGSSSSMVTEVFPHFLAASGGCVQDKDCTWRVAAGVSILPLVTAWSHPSLSSLSCSLYPLSPLVTVSGLHCHSHLPHRWPPCYCHTTPSPPPPAQLPPRRAAATHRPAAEPVTDGAAAAESYYSSFPVTAAATSPGPAVAAVFAAGGPRRVT